MEGRLEPKIETTVCPAEGPEVGVTVVTTGMLMKIMRGPVENFCASCETESSKSRCVEKRTRFSNEHSLRYVFKIK